MDRLISLQAAVDAVKSYWKAEVDAIPKDADFGTFTATCDLILKCNTEMCKVLDGIPSAQPEQQWIPCSERLPDTPIRVQVQLDNGWIITAYRQEDEWLSVPDCGEDLHDEWVIAWMPLPESYKEKDNEKDNEKA